MTDFDFDCLQKKRIAQQARYRKRGSKSKKCNLPSDRLTQKQWKERCGPVVSFNFNKPMNWDTFKKLSTIVQTEYITNLQKKYGVTAVDLGDMFGVRALTVRKHVDANGLNITFPRGHSMNAERKAVWNEFLGIVPTNVVESVPKNAVDEAPAEEVVEEVVEAEVSTAQTEPEPETVIAPMEPNGMNMKKFCLQFAGVIDINMIANSLKLILGEQSSGELEIICNLA